MRSRALLAFATAFMACPVALLSQASTPSPVGVVSETRVRISTRDVYDPWIGHFVRRDGDTIWVRPPGTTGLQFIPRATVTDFRVSRGFERPVGRRAWRGFLIGAGSGFFFGGLMALGDPEGAEWFGGQVGATAFMTGFFAVPGAVIGAISGIPRRERWVRVPTP
jgi:hypothetical protein